MEFFTEDTNLIAQICELLTSCGCCSRCTLRYLGLKDMYTYRGETEEMNCLVSKFMTKKMEVDQTHEDTTDKDSVDSGQTDAELLTKTESPNNITDTKESSVVLANGNETSICDSAKADTNDKTDKQNTNCDTEIDKAMDKTNSVEQPGGTMQCLNVMSTCVVCFGVLEQFTADAFLQKINSDVVDKGFVFSTYFCSLMLPVCVILRETLMRQLLQELSHLGLHYLQHALMLYLKEKFGSVYSGKKYTDVATVKDVWKWKNGPILNKILGAPFDTKSPFEITLTFSYKDSDKECNFLFSSGSDVFRQRKQDRRHKNKSNFAVFTRANVATTIEKMSEEEFRKDYQCPPLPPSCRTVCDIKCQNEAVFVAGRYNKYSRVLSQTPWLIEGKRKCESSVEELLCQEINRNFKPKEVKFSSSGREDVDVLMLGDGRPFVLELINPCRRDFSQEELNEMQKILNSSTKDIRCRDLQMVTREDVDQLKQGEIDKIKLYQALCWTSEPVTEDQLNRLTDMKDLKILQKTPIRVLHRRPLSTRDKIIHSMSVQRVDQYHFTIDMATQAGTYIKEFVHGDLGRTLPNLSTLLEVDCDILELDVKAVELDWPKKIPDQVS